MYDTTGVGQQASFKYVLKETQCFNTYGGFSV